MIGVLRKTEHRRSQAGEEKPSLEKQKANKTKQLSLVAFACLRRGEADLVDPRVQVSRV